MEDPELEWEIEEYPPPKEDGKGKLRWILDKGYGVGKKVVITGIAISSAPLILPPLVFFTTLGIAFSVPSGLALAGYVCADKIMSKLLPMPTTPSSPSEYYYTGEDEEEEEGNRCAEDGFLMENEMGFKSEEGSDDFSGKEQGSITNSDKNVDEKGYISDGEDDEFMKEYAMQEEEKQEMEDVKQAVEARFEMDEGGDDDYSPKEEMMVKNLDEEGYESDGVSDGEEVKEIKITEPVIVKEIKSQKLAKEGNKEEEELVEMRRVVVLVEGNEDNNRNSREVEELDLVAREVKGDDSKEGKKTDSGAGDGHEDDTILREKKEDLIDSNADAREIADESGLDLFDDRNAGSYQDGNMNFENSEGNEFAAEDSVDVLELPTFRKLLRDPDYTKVISKLPSSEAFMNESKIWEQIGALRAVVGYKAKCQPTCIGELKALYVFTGVEPPVSFKDDSDLVEVNDKLKFLMSIVGVK